jgi:two-component system, OmpR family, sensor histidine kinase KdpD
MQSRLYLVARCAASVGLVLLVTAAYAVAFHANPTTVALTYVVAILLVASAWGVVESMVASVVATICLNVFFLPPVGALTIADPENWIALVAFLATGLVASQLSGQARRRNVEAIARQRDLERLYALSRGLLLSPGRPSMPAVLARQVADTFDFPVVAVYDHASDTVAWAGSSDSPAVEARLRESARQGVSVNEAGMQIAAIRLGGAPIGSLAIPESDLSDTVLQSVANLAAIGLERARGQEAAARAEVAQQSGELRATMLDALAHEFKTPLTSMKVAASDLHANAHDDRSRELAAIVEEDLDRLQSLVSDTVNMVRVDSGDFTLRLNDHALAGIVGAVLRQFEARLDGHRVLTRVPESLSLRADRELLALALRQLIDNALKYSPATSEIEVAAAVGETVDLLVRNSGPAIPEREQGRLGERFYRGSQARRVPGTGMGLAIVRQVAEAHGGRLSVSSSVETGTAFTISLPREAARP